MTQWIPAGKTSSPATPYLVLATASRGTSDPINFARSGLLMAPHSAEYAVFSAEDELAEPTQMFPSSGTAAVDLVADLLSVGRYVARWSPAADIDTTQRYEIHWTVVLQPGDAPTEWVERIDVLPSGQKPAGYCTVRDVRAEGFVVRDASDVRIWRSIGTATRFIEQVTGRFFEPRYLPFLKVNGSGNRMALLQMPICALGNVTIDTSPFSPADLPVDPSLYRVYNRHLAQGLLQPDDRDNPKIELFYSSEDLIGRRAPYAFTSLIWPRGQQNLTLEGIYGYTDPDGGFVGQTPEAIRRVCVLLAARELYTLKDRDRREDARRRWALVAESTRDQSYNLNPQWAKGLSQSFTGDPEIDQVLAQYMRPPALGAT